MLLKKNKILNKPYKLISQIAYTKKGSIKLDWNEFPYELPNFIKKILFNKIQKSNLNWYPNIYPKKLIKSISSYAKVNQSQISVFSGSDSFFECFSKVYLDSKKKFLILRPNYDQVRLEASTHTKKILFYDVINHLDIYDIIAKIKSLKVNVVYISNPNNPLGYYIENTKLIKIIKQCRKVFFIVDEAYIEYSGKNSISYSLQKFKIKNLFITRTFSKCFGIAALRLGYCISDKKNIAKLNTFKNFKQVNTLAIAAGKKILENVNFYKKKIQEINNSKKLLENFFKKNKIKYFPSYGNFITFRISNKKKFIKFLEKKKIFIRDLGHLKVIKNYVRLTIGTNKQNKIFLKNMSIFLNK